MRRIAVLSASDETKPFNDVREFHAGSTEAAWTFYRAQQDQGRDVVAVHAKEATLDWAVKVLMRARPATLEDEK